MREVLVKEVGNDWGEEGDNPIFDNLDIMTCTK